MLEIIPEVMQAVPGAGYKIYAYMNDGSIHCFDANHLIKAGGVFAPLKDMAVFRKTLTVLNGTAAFDLLGNRDETQCVDIDPYTLQEAPRVSDPLE